MIRFGTSWTFLVIVIGITLQKYSLYNADYIKIPFFKEPQIPVPNLCNMCVIIALQYKSIEQKSYSYYLPTNKYFLTAMNGKDEITNIKTVELSVNIACIERRTLWRRYKMRYEVDLRIIANNNNNLWYWIKACGKLGDYSSMLEVLSCWEKQAIFIPISAISHAV